MSLILCPLGFYTNVLSIATLDALGALRLLVSRSELASMARQHPYGVDMDINAGHGDKRLPGSRIAVVFVHALHRHSYLIPVTPVRVIPLPVSLQLHLPCVKDERDLSSRDYYGPSHVVVISSSWINKICVFLE